LYIYYACWVGPNLVLGCFGCPIGWALLCCIVFFLYFLKIVNVSAYHIVLLNAVSLYLYLPDTDTRIRIHAG
jgi:hypothetical protein